MAGHMLDDRGMLVNTEILNVVGAHLSVPCAPDGACGACGVSDGSDHGADHLINALVKHFNLPWVRRYDARTDGAWPPDFAEDALAWRKAHHPEENNVSDWADENEEQITDADVVEYPEEEAVVDPEDVEGDEELDDLVNPLVRVRVFSNVDDLLDTLEDEGYLDEGEEEEGVPVSLVDLREVALLTALALHKNNGVLRTSQAVVKDAKRFYKFLAGDVV